MDHKLTRLKELIELKEQTDAELEALLGGAPPEARKQRKPQTCSVCGEEGHTARTCKRRPAMYTVIKTIRGRRYRYLQRSWREGKRVRTKSTLLGRADGTERYNADFDPIHQGQLENMAWPHWSVTTKNLTSGKDGLSGKLQSNATPESNRKRLESLHEQFGLRMPDPGDPKDTK
jgi:hypothetical protein